MKRTLLAWLASHKKIEIEGTEIFHFEKDKIKEGWTIFNMAELAK